MFLLSVRYYLLTIYRIKFYIYTESDTIIDVLFVKYKYSLDKTSLFY